MVVRARWSLLNCNNQLHKVFTTTTSHTALLAAALSLAPTHSCAMEMYPPNSQTHTLWMEALIFFCWCCRWTITPDRSGLLLLLLPPTAAALCGCAIVYEPQHVSHNHTSARGANLHNRFFAYLQLNYSKETIGYSSFQLLGLQDIPVVTPPRKVPYPSVAQVVANSYTGQTPKRQEVLCALHGNTRATHQRKQDPLLNPTVADRKLTDTGSSHSPARCRTRIWGQQIVETPAAGPPCGYGCEKNNDTHCGERAQESREGVLGEKNSPKSVRSSAIIATTQQLRVANYRARWKQPI